MEIDDFLGLLKKRRSMRRFKPDPIPDEYIEKILEAARWAMSGANAQPWEFVVVKDQETKDKMAEFFIEGRMEAYSIERTRLEELRHHQLRTLPKGLPSFKDAPVLIAVCGDRRTLQATVLATHFSPGGELEHTFIMNIANAIQIMHLAVAALGLGSQWVSFGQAFEQKVKALLDVPDMLEILAIVPIGYTAYVPAGVYRRKLKEIVHYEKYDRSRYRSGEDIIKFLADLRKRTRRAYDQEAGLP